MKFWNDNQDKSNAKIWSEYEAAFAKTASDWNVSH